MHGFKFKTLFKIPQGFHGQGIPKFLFGPLSLLVAGSLESANSSILAVHNLFKDFGGGKNQDFMIIWWPIS